MVSAVVLRVILSLFEVPVSSASARFRAAGAEGMPVSIVIDKADDAGLALPAGSVCTAVILRLPAASAPAVRVTVLLAQVADVPVATASEYN